jgi:hypothetical protein
LCFRFPERSIAAPPHRPADPKIHWSDDASSPGLCCLTTHAGRRTRSCARLPASHRAASGVWLPPSRRPPPSLGAPCGAPASSGFTLQGVLLAPIAPPFGGPSPRDVPRVDSPRPPGERADAGAFRALIPVSSSFLPRNPCGSRSSMPSWASSLPSTPSFRPYGRFVSRSLPHHALGGLTSRPACVSRCCGAEGLVDPSRGYRLAWVSSPSDRHSATRVVRRAGVWIRLTDRARCKRHDPIQAPSLRPDQSFRPGPALPSVGERLLPLPFAAFYTSGQSDA